MDTSKTYINMECGLPNKPIPHTAIAYLAGLIDGEGTISLRRKIGTHFNIEVYITSTNKPMLDWVSRLFGGKIYTYNRKDDKTRLPQHKWHIHSKNAEVLLRMVIPYLTIKSEHARLAIEFRELMNRDTSWHREFANKIKSIQKSVTFAEPHHQVSQDQLQEMLSYKVPINLVYGIFEFSVVVKNRWEIRHDDEYASQFTSMEQLWLAFVMKSLYQKIWSGENWKDVNHSPEEKMP